MRDNSRPTGSLSLFERPSPVVVTVTITITLKVSMIGQNSVCDGYQAYCHLQDQYSYLPLEHANDIWTSFCMRNHRYHVLTQPWLGPTVITHPTVSIIGKAFAMHLRDNANKYLHENGLEPNIYPRSLGTIDVIL